MGQNVLQTLSEDNGGAIQDPRTRRREVAQDLIAIAYRQGVFVAANGVVSDYHLDPALFMTKPTLLRRLGSLLAEQIDTDVDRIAGREPGSAALAIATALHTGLPYVSLRPTSPESSSSTVCGELHANERVILIEDVLSSGSHALRGARTLTESNATLVAVLGVIDRGEGATEALTAAGITYMPMFAMDELAKRHAVSRHSTSLAQGGQRDI
ncbi:orotate phosphoribosyltransferase (plasmid) [Arthrobacter sp. UC242_113]|uniref:orotate phosphoribosyltransferase n=1 Tax=Arthrobacter sp. UC242_113 TaxID=3374550 RepID=UPI003757AD38